MNNIKINQEKIVLLFVRFALAIGFISAVADRFGLWGNAGESGVAWGNFETFEAYVAFLNPYLHSSMIPVLSWGVTIVELVLAGLLILGLYLRSSALFSALLLLSFAIGMSFVSGVKAPLDYSVFTAASAAIMLFLYLSSDKLSQKVEIKK
ncbi:MauE/DoxX family redox-associated membrane protein [Poseidonibacter lekithochrous]|uniref:MauE/DoxX family redox-associated membrane protein n=1 Tax=Poseidonibacter lekithochrous TaxID=1904463 RepID=UPI000D3D3DD3|nr:hypothetical protein [Poseidonibacter lekithochrous]